MRIQSLFSFVTVSLVACTGAATLPPLPAPDAPEAFVGRTMARFAFPAESASIFTWHNVSGNAYVGSPEYVWAVRWDPSQKRVGLDPDGVTVSVYWRPGGPHTGTLSQLVASAARGTVDTYCGACPGDLPASTTQEVSWVRGEVVGNRLVLTIRGRREVERLFPHVPDSVLLARYSPAGWPEAEWTVVVRRQ